MKCQPGVRVPGFLNCNGEEISSRPGEMDKDLQTQGPTTEHLFVLRNVTDLRDKRGASSKAQSPLCFPRGASKRRQRKPTGRKQAAARPMPRFPRTRSRQLKTLLPRSIASEMAIPLGTEGSNRITTGKAEPCLVEAAGGQDQKTA